MIDPVAIILAILAIIALILACVALFAEALSGPCRRSGDARLNVLLVLLYSGATGVVIAVVLDLLTHGY